MFTTYFSSNQVLSLLLVALIHLASIYYFTFKKNIRYAMFFLFTGGLIVRIIIISWDNYFHLWDEQYHALVAKNMAENPFVPMLFKYAPLSFDHYGWTACRIWLHKQPLFLWQMALSIKLFGATPFAVRLPSAIMSSLLIPVIFRMGKLTINARGGYLASFLYAVCNYLLDFNTGQYNTDHNDVAFIFYVTLSIWGYTEYCVEKKLRYVWLIGLFAGLAILNKWLTGFVVFSGWAVACFFIRGIANKKSELKNILKSLVVCFLVFLPWQIYKMIRFPVESSIEYKQYVQHFTEPMDGHSGNMLYHFSVLGEQYGQMMAYALPLALILLFRDIKNISLRVGYFTCLVAVYLFFTITQTKMPAFCLIVSPILFISMGNLLNNLFRIIWGLNPVQDFSLTSHSLQIEDENKKSRTNKYFLRFVEFVLLLTIGVVSFNIEKLQANHTDWIKNDSRAWCNKNIMRATEFGKSIKGRYDEKKTLIINCKETDNIPIMFFSGYTAYSRIPNPEEFSHLKKEGYKILYFDDFAPIPDYLKNDSSVFHIKSFRDDPIQLKAMNGKYVCADGNRDNILVADRAVASTWETFSLLNLGYNKYAICSYANKYWSAESGQKTEITATRDKIAESETFIIIELDSNRVAFMATNGKYLSVDEKSFQLSASADFISRQEKFGMIIK